MLLFFDTETTGLAKTNMPPSWEGQPHLVQLAALLTEDDGTERASISLIVRPPAGVQIPNVASDVHGITDDVAARCGVTPTSALGVLYRLAQVADTLVAHNAPFDQTVVLAQAHRAGRAEIFDHIERQAIFCTMNAASPIVDLPPTERMVAAGFNKPKPPRLEECIRHFFGEDLEGAHDAMADVRACKRVYFALKE